MNYLYSNSYLGICLRSNSNQDSSQNQSTRVSNINDNSVSKWHLWSCTCTSRMGRRTPIAPLARGIFIYKNKRFWKDGFFSTPTKKYLLYSLLPRVFQWGMACFLIKHLSSFQILLEKSMQHPKFTWWYSWPIPNPLLRRDFSVRLAMYTEDAGHVMQGDREGSWLALPASPRASTVAGSHLHKLWSALPASPWVLAPSSNFNSRSFTAEKTWDRWLCLQDSHWIRFLSSELPSRWSTSWSFTTRHKAW